MRTDTQTELRNRALRGSTVRGGGSLETATPGPRLESPWYCGRWHAAAAARGVKQIQLYSHGQLQVHQFKETPKVQGPLRVSGKHRVGGCLHSPAPELSSYWGVPRPAAEQHHLGSSGTTTPGPHSDRLTWSLWGKEPGSLCVSVTSLPGNSGECSSLRTTEPRYLPRHPENW